MKFAVQLYALRDRIARHGLEDALRMISEAGFEGVEFAGFYGKSAEEILALLKKYRLTAVSAHAGAQECKDCVSFFQALSLHTVIVPWLDFNGSLAYEDGVKLLKETGDFLSEHGIALGYHNHAHEFKDGTDAVSRLAEDLPALRLEPDVFWLAAAGADAPEFLTRHKDRIAFVHVKELGEGGAEGTNPVVGEGKARIGEVLALAKKFGVEWGILEVERVDIPMAEYLKRSYAFMKKYN